MCEVKRRASADDIADGDDDCTIVSPPAKRRASEPCMHQLGPGEELEIVADTGQVALRDLPHERASCVGFKFSNDLKPCSANRWYCAQCYCYVCDVKASACSMWGTGLHASDHCNAHRTTGWTSLRNAMRAGLTAQVQQAYAAKTAGPGVKAPAAAPSLLLPRPQAAPVAPARAMAMNRAGNAGQAAQPMIRAGQWVTMRPERPVNPPQATPAGALPVQAVMAAFFERLAEGLPAHMADLPAYWPQPFTMAGPVPAAHQQATTALQGAVHMAQWQLMAGPAYMANWPQTAAPAAPAQTANQPPTAVAAGLAQMATWPPAMGPTGQALAANWPPAPLAGAPLQSATGRPAMAGAAAMGATQTQMFDNLMYRPATLPTLPKVLPKPAAQTKEKKKKDPNAPKKPCGAYIFFCQDKRAEVRASNPGIKVIEIANKLGEMWREVDDASKAKYIKLAEVDKARYETEMDAYKGKTGPVQVPQGQAQAATAAPTPAQPVAEPRTATGRPALMAVRPSTTAAAAPQQQMTARPDVAVARAAPIAQPAPTPVVVGPVRAAGSPEELTARPMQASDGLQTAPAQHTGSLDSPATAQTAVRCQAVAATAAALAPAAAHTGTAMQAVTGPLAAAQAPAAVVQGLCTAQGGEMAERAAMTQIVAAVQAAAGPQTIPSAPTVTGSCTTAPTKPFAAPPPQAQVDVRMQLTPEQRAACAANAQLMAVLLVATGVQAVANMPRQQQMSPTKALRP